MTDDVILECEGKAFRASRDVLCCASPYFSAMFHSSFREALSGRVCLENMTANALDLVLGFASTGKLPDANGGPTQWIELLEASHLLQLEVLVHHCLRNISNNVSLTNFFEVWLLANLYDCTGLGAKAATLVAMNFDQVSQNPDFMKLNTDQMKEVIQNPELKASSGKVIARAVYSWIDFEVATREPYWVDLISLINVSLCQKCQNVLSHVERIRVEETAGSCSCVSYVQQKTASYVKGNSNAKLLCFVEDNQECSFKTFHLDTREWSITHKLPLRLDFGMTLVTYGNYVYFLGGGRTGPCIQPAAIVYRYSVITKSLSCTGTLKRAVACAGGGTLNGWIYVVNGLNVEKRGVPFVQRYNAATGACQEIASTNEGHVRPYVFSYADYVYVVGSKTSAERSVEQLDAITDQWTTVGGIPGSINWCRVAGFGHQLFVVRRITEKKIHKFDLVSKTWREIDFQGGPHRIFGMWAAPSNDSHSPWTLLVTSEDGSVFSYRPDCTTWEQIAQEEPSITDCKWHQSLVVF